ncbi:FecCD family ABC transporter permease [Nakamurella multipartita]|uniref:Transport system permease protein n=1 Tax=Nakamurella multipartita (strain ATCC 700099 / DSM 44233 / CIP 104796 / JCM 9543 / NBRC 105858 / Y-104) TaxID=479431 RepID=C8XBW8_NAKMY|nr:iron chelate uptake ABC transporter family permease subunit [Nakamurella multipartita]ACV79472.1 transport system permease protein [Nakamurella multipartita DSM 44233]
MLAPARSRRDTRVLVVTVATLAALLPVLVLAIAAGSSQLGLGDVVRTLIGAGTPSQELIVLELRLPRVLCGALVGAALGLAGALTQTFARNPLATPDILGVTSGAALGAVAAIVLAGGSYSVGAGALTLGLPAAAAIGALGTAAVVYGLSWRSGVDSYRLILVGIGATAALTGVTSFLIARAQLTEASTAAQWLVGSLSGVSWASVWPVLVAVAVLTPIALTQSSTLSVSLLGDDVSTGLGVAVQRHRLVIVACAVLLTAAAVSAAGPIEFVAFVSPQIVRRLAGTARPPLLASAVVGALVVVGADTLSRTVLPGEVPVGIVTAVIGAPYLIWLLTRRKDREMLT